MTECLPKVPIFLIIQDSRNVVERIQEIKVANSERYGFNRIREVKKQLQQVTECLPSQDSHSRHSHHLFWGENQEFEKYTLKNQRTLVLVEYEKFRERS